MSPETVTEKHAVVDLDRSHGNGVDSWRQAVESFDSLHRSVRPMTWYDSEMRRNRSHST